MQAVVHGDNVLLTPTEASSRLADVIANRSSLAASSRALDPPTALGRQVRDKLAVAFDLALDNDRDIRNCLDAGRISETLAIIFSDCLNASGASSGRASAAKQDFRDAYNQLRRQLGMGQTNPSF
jgi:hypothetical protein